MNGRINGTAPAVKPASDAPQLLLENQLCFPLYACARKIVAQYTPHLTPLGLTYTQYIVMLSLWEKGESTVGDLCRKLYLDSGTLTPLLKKLEAAGYIRRERARQDERVVCVTLTENGWILREQARGIPELVGRCMPLTPEEAGAMYRMLHKMLDRIG